jgi:hypothetical protein
MQMQMRLSTSAGAAQKQASGAKSLVAARPGRAARRGVAAAASVQQAAAAAAAATSTSLLLLVGGPHCLPQLPARPGPDGGFQRRAGPGDDTNIPGTTTHG